MGKKGLFDSHFEGVQPGNAYAAARIKNVLDVKTLSLGVFVYSYSRVMMQDAMLLEDFGQNAHGFVRVV